MTNLLLILSVWCTYNGSDAFLLNSQRLQQSNKLGIQYPARANLCALSLTNNDGWIDYDQREEKELNSFNKELHKFLKNQEKIDNAPDPSRSLLSMEALLNFNELENGVNNQAIKDAIPSIRYKLLPDLIETLQKKRLQTLSKLERSYGNAFNRGAFYLATYLAIKQIDFRLGPFTSALFMYPDLTKNFSELKNSLKKCADSLHLGQLSYAPLIQESLWFESLMLDEISLPLQEIMENVCSEFSELPIKIAQDHADKFAQLKKLSEIVKGDQIETSRIELALSQSFAVYILGMQSESLFIEIWERFYKLFDGKDAMNPWDNIAILHQQLMAQIGISYYGTNPGFQRFDEASQGVRRRFDFFANYFRSILQNQFEKLSSDPQN